MFLDLAWAVGSYNSSPQARETNSSQPNPGPRRDTPPCTMTSFDQLAHPLSANMIKGTHFRTSYVNLPPAGPSGCRSLGVLPPQRRIGEDGDGGGRRLFLRRRRRRGEEPPRHGRQVQAEVVQGETGERDKIVWSNTFLKRGHVQRKFATCSDFGTDFVAPSPSLSAFSRNFLLASSPVVYFISICAGSSKRKGAKFVEGSFVRADWPYISCPK